MLDRRLLLLATTAAVSLISMPGRAGAADPIKLSLGGYAVTGLTIRTQDNLASATTAPVNRGAGDDRVNTSGVTTDIGTSDVFWETEVWFLGETTLDNGIKVGVNIQLEAYTSSDQIDEHFVYAEGKFGRLVVGAENAAPYIMHYKAPSPSRGEFAVDDNRDLLPFRSPTSNAAASVSTFT